jgi:hypothetical protein
MSEPNSVVTEAPVEVPVAEAPVVEAPVSAEVPVSAPAEIEVKSEPVVAATEFQVADVPAVLPAHSGETLTVVDVSEHVFINGRDYGRDGLTLDYSEEV